MKNNNGIIGIRQVDGKFIGIRKALELFEKYNKISVKIDAGDTYLEFAEMKNISIERDNLLCISGSNGYFTTSLKNVVCFYIPSGLEKTICINLKEFIQ